MNKKYDFLFIIVLLFHITCVIILCYYLIHLIDIITQLNDAVNLLEKSISNSSNISDMAQEENSYKTRRTIARFFGYLGIVLIMGSFAAEWFFGDAN